MAKKDLTDKYDFESRESYERAKKEEHFVEELKRKTNLDDEKTALKVYNKLVSDKVFSTVVGYDFLAELRH
ncbi:MAG: hypothetical protein K6G62_00415, partial [Eubacterium sp.]|nr:hypothetical protein [Eubacterium sp.]